MLKENRRPWPRRPNLTPLRVFCAVLATGALALLCAVAYMEAHFRLAPETVEGYAGAAGPLAFTLRINTFRRDDLLRGALEHYSRCANVEEITVVWSDQARSPPDASGWSLAPEPRARVEFERHAADRLSNRFRPLKAPPTEAILSLDDDVLLDCRSLDRARDAWESAKSSLVGFSPRLHTWDPAQRRFTYRSWWYVYWTGRYSIMLTKCAFLHRDLLHRFHELPSDLVDFVDEQRNCEDILMAFVAARESRGAPPVWVGAVTRDSGDGGISSGSAHFDRRSECINYFAAHEWFRGAFLPVTSGKVVDARTRWTWAS